VGIPRSEESKKKDSETNMGKHRSPETEFKVGEHRHPETEFRKGEHPGVEFKKGHRESELTKEVRIRNVFKSVHMKPNKKEKDLDSVLQELLPGEYALNVKGDIVILGGKVPDFVNINGQKKIVELFGDYWHSEEFIQRTGHSHSENDRKEYFKQFGWDTLVVWEHELKDKTALREKILTFSKEAI
jgi:G:T-mismatch repair DNA endonuclease (very short patch repair protein)